MIPKRCGREVDVIRAAQGDQWDADLIRHIGACEICADVLFVEEQLRKEITDAPDVVLPDPLRLWWQARVSTEDKVLKPLEAMSHVSVVVVAAVGLFVLTTAPLAVALPFVAMALLSAASLYAVVKCA